jgi:hypothetical protein
LRRENLLNFARLGTILASRKRRVMKTRVTARGSVGGKRRFALKICHCKSLQAALTVSTLHIVKLNYMRHLYESISTLLPMMISPPSIKGLVPYLSS